MPRPVSFVKRGWGGLLLGAGLGAALLSSCGDSDSKRKQPYQFRLERQVHFASSLPPVEAVRIFPV